jgi:hypothetical protein
VARRQYIGRALAANPEESLRDLQNYALLLLGFTLLGFTFAGRASDLISLEVVDDLEFTDRGLGPPLRNVVG